MVKDTGIDYDEMKDAFISDELSYEDAIKYRVQYGSVSDDDAKKTVNEWKVEKQYGYEYKKIDDKLMNKTISAAEAKKAYMTYGMSDEDATQKVELIEFKRDNPGTDDFSYSAMKNYKTYCKSAGVSTSMFNDVYNVYKNTKGDKKKDTVLTYINKQAISTKQKDALYFACGYAESKLKDAPWH